MKKRCRSNVNPIPVMIQNGVGYPKTIKVRIHVEGRDDHIEINLPHTIGTFVIGDAIQDFLNDLFRGQVECVEILQE